MTVRLPLSVRYAETDAMAVVHHASYVVWLEAARVEWLEKIGLPYTQIEAEGLAFSVNQANLTYRAPARFGDRVEVEVWLSELGSRSISFDYRVWRDQTVLVEARTRHLCQDRSGRAVRIPAHILELMQRGHRPAPQQ